MTSALKLPRKPPKESVRLSTERGEAEASGERSLAAEAKAAAKAAASGAASAPSAAGFLWLSMLPSERERWCPRGAPAPAPAASCDEDCGETRPELHGLTRPPGCASSAACCARLSHLRSQTSVPQWPQSGEEASPSSC